MSDLAGVEVGNHLKWIADEFAVTWLMIGVRLTDRGLLGEGGTRGDAALAQTWRRTARLGMRPFIIEDEPGRREWRQMLLALEQRVVLADKRRDVLGHVHDRHWPGGPLSSAMPLDHTLNSH